MFSNQRDVITVQLAIDVYSIWTIIAHGSTTAWGSGIGNIFFSSLSTSLSLPTTFASSWGGSSTTQSKL
jgi:hypothetical protein